MLTPRVTDDYDPRDNAFTGTIKIIRMKHREATAAHDEHRSRSWQRRLSARKRTVRRRADLAMILVVADDATVRLILADVLSELGYDVLPADARPAIPSCNRVAASTL